MIENKIYTFKEIVEKVGEITTPSSEKSEQIINNIRNNIKQYIKQSNIKSLVVGISGGLDSAVIASLCQEKYTGIPLIGISIPLSSSNTHKKQAKWVGEEYCSVFEEFQEWERKKIINKDINKNHKRTSIIEEIFNTTALTDKLAAKAGFITNDFPKNILQGNIKARMRMITLYDIARKTNGMVISTDNLSEFQMGFWTICGDVGDFGPIQNIGKGFELPAIANVLGIREDIIYQKPSDGLMVTEDNTDEAQLGANYKEVDAIMSIYLKTLINNIEWDNIERSFNIIKEDITKDGHDKINNIIERYNNLEYKRNGTINLTREEIGI